MKWVQKWLKGVSAVFSRKHDSEQLEFDFSNDEIVPPKKKNPSKKKKTKK
ncbi:MAG: hypothetical protein ACKO7N_05565 [Candidatus Nitrosotenuis sp.]